MTTILVTGGCGFIGCNFVRLMLTDHPDVKLINLDALTYAGNPENLADMATHPSYDFVLGDIRDDAFVDQVVREHDVDGIINFAAESHVDRSIEEPNIFVETNVTGTLNLLRSAVEHGVQRYLQVSTDEVYGSLEPDAPAFSETTPLCPNSPYAATKAAADHLVHAFCHTYKLDAVITRCSNNYGPYQFPEKMIPLMFNNAGQDQKLPVYGDGLQIRDWLYVVDHCRAVWAAFERGKTDRVYNIGGENEKTNLEVVQLILDYLEKPYDLITHVDDRMGHDRRYAINATRARKELNWAPSVDFSLGLQKTLDWYAENRDWVSNVTSGAYQEYYDRMYKNR